MSGFGRDDFSIGQRYRTRKGALIEIAGFHSDGRSLLVRNLTTGEEVTWKPEWFQHLLNLYDYALFLLQQTFNNSSAEFRDGQWQAIEQLVCQQARLLVVQRTGWGKSLVYFMATRLLREQGEGCTLLISPLLALMRNQIEAAQRLQVKAASINTDNKTEWSTVQAQLLNGELDLLLISPERLANEEFQTKMFRQISDRIGLFVVDEAHCISDWGHDFRPDYQRITRILQSLPATVPVLATTATANNRVVADIKRQLGDNLQILRSALTRKSLQLQNISLPSQSARLAWLAQHLPTIPGSGIVYTLTKRDADQVANWLISQEIDAAAYHSDLTSETKQALEDQLQQNSLKVLIATVALGMGFDKPDLAFVIHYQCPGSVVHYYQQVGRAGRSIDQAYGILLSGLEDEDITNFFIQSAFPPEAHVEQLLKVLQRAEDGFSRYELEEYLNLSRGQIEKVLKLLEVVSPSPIARRERKYYATPVNYQPNREKIDRLIQIRREEQTQMATYMRSEQCLMMFLAKALDDPDAQPCGRCEVCLGHPLLPPTYTDELSAQAMQFLQQSDYPMFLKRQIPAMALETYGWSGRLPEPLRGEIGRCLSIWGDAGWGRLVKQGKFQNGYFDDDLVEASYQMIQRWEPQPFPTWITCVPSLNHPDLVPNFTQRLAGRLSLPFVPCIQKTRSTQPQKQMNNSFQQIHNLDGAFTVTSWAGMDGAVFLVDDIVDSGWTLTIMSALLRESSSGAVFPIALADSSSMG